MDWTTLAGQFAFPAVCLIAIAYYVTRAIGAFWTDMALPLRDAFIAFLSNQTAQSKAQSADLQRLDKAVKQIGARQEDHIHVCEGGHAQPAATATAQIL